MGQLTDDQILVQLDQILKHFTFCLITQIMWKDFSQSIVWIYDLGFVSCVLSFLDSFVPDKYIAEMIKA